MFAEDIELLPDHIFTNALKERWLEKPYKFKEEVESLWQAMNQGDKFGYEKLLYFNGNLFSDATAFNLKKEQLEILLSASEKDWKSVEPAIFGTLLEQALETDERSQLGAHYTPRSYVERLVRPTVIEPLQEQWQLIQGEVEHILDTESEATHAENVDLAKTVLDDFLKQLREIKVLDPACGSGNFLYVTLDLMKTLELEVFNRLETVTGKSQLKLEFEKVNPSQFLGIEINPRAAAIADLVIWIGYLQWHFRLFGTLPPIEPVLREYKNIEFRDAVLAYDKVKTAVDPKTGKVRTRWGGKTIKHPVTGEDVPDPNDQVKILHYVRPRPAQWPEADYIVSNPPFIGNKQMRDLLGDGYTEALRKIYKNVPETVDLVMYWWEKAANLLAQKKIKRFGLITTNSIKQAFNRPVLLHHLKESELSLYYAIPDHPWVNVKDGAAVRVALTVAISGNEQEGIFQEVTQELPGDDGVVEVTLITNTGKIYADLTIGSDIASMQPLKANENMSFQGVIPLGKGFRLTREMLLSLGFNINNLPSVIRPYMIGRDLVQIPQKKWIIDFFELEKDEAMQNYPNLFQIILDKVKPSRDYNRDKFFREKWWLFGRARSDLRNGIKGLSRFIVTPDTSKFKPFVFLDSSVLPDVQLYSVVSDDAWILGVLESKIHQTWLQEVAPRMGKGNDLRWKPSIVFHPFPFPAPSETLKQQIRDLGERLDNHRKTVQANHPDITLTGMYNLLEKMRKEEPFSAPDQAYNNRALVSILKQIHDELDTAVFAAYGWPQNLTEGEILERLVALNLERAEEEKNGLIRWLRPDYQAPDQITTQKEIEGIEIENIVPIAPVELQKFPTTFKEQLTAIRELLRTQNREWTI
ncbi:MAG: class I SAM-dependent DNA methyltransferase, partial [Microcystaceae cyanobacterium]